MAFHYKEFPSEIYCEKLKELGIENVYISRLFEIMPACIDTKKHEPFNNFWFRLEKRSTKNIQYICNYHCDTYDIMGDQGCFPRTLLDHNIYDEELSNCLAKMLIELIERGYLIIA